MIYLATASIISNIILFCTIIYIIKISKQKIIDEKLSTFNNVVDAFTFAMQINDGHSRIEHTGRRLAKAIGSTDLNVIKEVTNDINFISLVTPFRSDALCDKNERLRALGSAAILPEDGDCERVLTYIMDYLNKDSGIELKKVNEVFSNETLIKVECNFKRRLLLLYYNNIKDSKINIKDILILKNIRA